jgi:hypothetical protein
MNFTCYYLDLYKREILILGIMSVRSSVCGVAAKQCAMKGLNFNHELVLIFSFLLFMKLHNDLLFYINEFFLVFYSF